MTDEKKKYGTHRRISDKNLERIKAVGKMGDSVDNVVGMLLNKVEDINRCLEGDEPQTEELRQLKDKWGTEAISEHLSTCSLNE